MPLGRLIAESDEMEPPQMAVEVPGGDAAPPAQKALDPAVAAVDHLDVQGAPNPLPCRAVVYVALVRDVERGCDGRIAAVGVGDQQGIRGEDRCQHRLHVVCAQPGRVWLRVAPARSAATGTRTCSRERPCFLALPPCRRGLRFSFRSPLRLSRTKVPSASTIPASRSGAWRTAARKQRWRRRCAVLGAIPQRAADSLIVSSAPREAPRDSQRSLRCSPDSAVPVRATNVPSQALSDSAADRVPCRETPHRRCRNADSAACYPRPTRSPRARRHPLLDPTAPPPLPCAAP